MFCDLKSSLVETNTKFLHTFADHQLYTASDYGVRGRIYRCENRKCPARVTLLPTGNCVRFSGAKPHNHETDCVKNVRDLKALNSMKRKCRDLRTVASGRRITKVKDIFTEVMIE